MTYSRVDSAGTVRDEAQSPAHDAHHLTLRSIFARRGPYVGTVLAHICALALTLFTLKLAAEKFDATTFGEFMVSRRAVTILAFPLLLGLGIGIPRYIGLARGSLRASEKSASDYFLASLGITVVCVPAFLAVAMVYQSGLAYIFFGDPDRAPLVLPTCLVVVGLYLHTIAYSYFLGNLTMLPANLLQIFNAGVAPALAVVLAADAFTALTILGATTVVASIGGVLVALRTVRHAPKSLTGTKGAALDLLRFGLPRVPGEFALYGLFAIPTFVVAHRFDIESAGYFSFGLSLVQLIGTPFGAVNMVLLPTFSGMAAREAWPRIAAFMKRFLLGTALLASAGVFAAELLFASPARSLLGPGLAQAVDASRLLLVASIPYVAYVVVRGALDAISPWPYNSINLMGSVLLVVALLLIWSTYEAAQLAVIIGLLALGVATLYTFARSLRLARAGTSAPASAELL